MLHREEKRGVWMEARRGGGTNQERKEGRKEGETQRDAKEGTEDVQRDDGARRCEGGLRRWHGGREGKKKRKRNWPLRSSQP